MTSKLVFRIKLYKRILRKIIHEYKQIVFKEKLIRLSAKSLAEMASSSAPGMSFTNVARDIRRFTEPGVDYDAEFDLLWRGHALPEVVDRYTEDLLTRVIHGVVHPGDLDARLAALRRTRPDGKPLYEDL